MPSLGFVLPHWLYWSGLLLFPLLAWALARREQLHPPSAGPSLAVAYLFWLLSGFIGIHRFYLRSALGIAFVAVFLALLYCNVQVREVRDDTSRTRAAAEAAAVDLRQAPDSGTERAEAERKLSLAQQEFAQAQGVTDRWTGRTRAVAGVLALMLLADAAWLPFAVRRRRALEGPIAPPTAVPELAEAITMQVHEGGVGQDPTLALRMPVTDAIDRFNSAVGRYVAWWAVIAVFVYYYEVLARYVFNSPTNWVHESMFLMFGMQYMLCGAFAYREDQHVRVDVVYARFSARGKAVADIVTSVFFFVFILTMLWTGTRFAWDAIQLNEHSFTEWGVQYWPVKLMIPVGALLMTLQGLSKLIKDVAIVLRRAG
jgi:TRAP-type mannitol/chloroaromatic compound transport system permease small subunit